MAPGVQCAAEDERILEAAGVIRRGGVVAFPTETVYGLGAAFNDERAVARVFELKGRPRFDPVIVHVADTGWLPRLFRELPEAACRLIERFWPGPLTLVLPKTEEVPDIVTAGLDTVGVRAPSHPVAAALISTAGVPLAAPSANRFGAVSPVEAAEVSRQLGDAPDMILDGGRCTLGIESTVVSLEHGQPRLLRPGALPLEALEEVVGKVVAAPPARRPLAPGQLPRHYAPGKPLTIVASLEDVPAAARGHAGALAFTRRLIAGFAVVEFLSDCGDLREAACNLFRALARLDGQVIERIFAEKAPRRGLGLAIMDRLTRAAGEGPMDVAD